MCFLASVNITLKRSYLKIEKFLLTCLLSFVLLFMSFLTVSPFPLSPPLPMPHPLNSHYLGRGAALATIPQIIDDSVDRITVPYHNNLLHNPSPPHTPNSSILFQNTSCTVVDVFYSMMSTQAALCIYTLWVS